MRLIILSIIFLLGCAPSFAQISTHVGAVQHVEIIDWKQTKLINKKTGEEMSEKDFAELVKEHPKLVLERSINKFGHVDKMFFDPDNLRVDGRKIRNEELQPKVGDLFPEFVFKTLSGKVYESSELTNDYVLVAFDFFPQRSSSISLNDRLKSFKNVNSFLCFASDDMISENTDFTEFEIVNFNTINFQEKFNITTPVAFLLDKNKKVLAKINRDNLDDLNKFLKN